MELKSLTVREIPQFIYAGLAILNFIFLYACASVWIALCWSVLFFLGELTGDVIRKAAMPDAIFTKGMIETLGKKIFWPIGFQLICGFLFPIVALINFDKIST